MFGSLGVPELIVIFVIALIIFGPRKLPEIGRSLGRSINEFKKASNELRNTLEDEIRMEDQRPTQPPTLRRCTRVSATPRTFGTGRRPGAGRSVLPGAFPARGRIPPPSEDDDDAARRWPFLEHRRVPKRANSSRRAKGSLVFAIGSSGRVAPGTARPQRGTQAGEAFSLYIQITH